MSLAYAAYCWRLYRKQMLAAPALLAACAAWAAWNKGGLAAFVPALVILALVAPLFAAFNGALGSHVLAAPWAECDEALPLSARERAVSLLVLIFAFIAAEIVVFYGLGILLIYGQLEVISGWLAAAVSVGLTVVASAAFAAALLAAGSLALFMFAGALQRQPQQAGVGTLISYGALIQGVLAPLAMGCAWLWRHPNGQLRSLLPALAVLAAAYALPAVHIQRATRLAWLEPGKWRRRAELAATFAALACVIFAARTFERAARASLEAWPELAAPYWGRLAEKNGALDADRSPLPGGTLVGYGDGRLYWVRGSGARELIKTTAPSALLPGIGARGEPRASFLAKGTLWVLYRASALEPQTLWTGGLGLPLSRVRELPAEPDVRAVFETGAGTVELLSRSRQGRWFRSPLGQDGDPLAWTPTALSVSTAALEGPPVQSLVGGEKASWTDEGSAMTLSVADSSGPTRRFLFSSGQLGTVGGGKPQPYALRYDGRFLWLVLAARTLAKAEAGEGGARLVAEWPLPDAGFMRARGHRIYRPAEDGVYVNTRRGVEVLGWDGSRRVLVPGGTEY